MCTYFLHRIVSHFEEVELLYCSFTWSANRIIPILNQLFNSGFLPKVRLGEAKTGRQRFLSMITYGAHHGCLLTTHTTAVVAITDNHLCTF